MVQPTSPSVKADRDWEAESDFHALAAAEEIKTDSRRMARAQRAGTKIVAREKRALTAKQKVAGRSRGKKR